MTRPFLLVPAALAVTLLLAAGTFPAASDAQTRSPENAARAFDRRAVEIALWAMPIVSFDAMREAYFREAGAQYNDLLLWSRPSDRLNQTTTPNATSHYVYANFNTSSGPVVLHLPPSSGLSMYGNLEDAWQVPVEDFGAKGIDAGKGGTYLLTPPGYSGPVPAGMTPIAMPTYNGYIFLRPTPLSGNPEEAAAANAWAGRVRLHALAQAGSPPPQRVIDMSGRLFDGIMRMDDSFFDRLARIIGEEQPNRRDMAMRGMLATLGIEPGKPFTPSASERKALADAARQAATEAREMLRHGRTRWWPDQNWTTSKAVAGLARGGMTFEQGDALRIDERAQVYFMAYALAKRHGDASFYLTQLVGNEGNPLDGSGRYTLHIPAGVPAGQFWAVTVYDAETNGFLRGAKVVGVDSNHRDIKVNRDGSVDILFSATPPARNRGNWIALVPGRQWFAAFRFYAPKPALFDKSWVLPSIAAEEEKKP